MTTLAPDAVHESLDPRDPLLRLSRFFDDGSIELLHERDRSGSGSRTAPRRSS
jgi:acetyl-CoA/propionyl-CoA carboxylase carboxyl transferase subunit